MEKFRANKNWIDLWNSVPVLQKPRALELAKKFKSVNKNWSQKGVATTHIVYFIIFENFGKVSAFVVRKLRLLKVLGSRALGLCCRSLRFYNNCKLSYLKNKNYFCLLFDFCKQGKVEAAGALVFQIQNFCPAYVCQLDNQQLYESVTFILNLNIIFRQFDMILYFPNQNTYFAKFETVGPTKCTSQLYHIFSESPSSH